MKFWISCSKTGCWCLGSPRMVKGFVGRSLNVTCHYKDKYAGQVKYWCRDSCWTSQKKIVETSKSGREGRRGRVSIRDHPANLTFTVTVENLTEADAGTYYCGIDTVLSFDPTFRVEVSVSPASTSTPTAVATTATNLTITMQMTTQTSTALATHSTSQEEPRQNPRSPVLLSLLALVLLLLLGISLLAWRMIPRQVKAAKNSGPLQNSSQGEPYYANMELKTRPLQSEPRHPPQVDVEYSTVEAPREELLYTTVVFDAQSQDSAARGLPPQRPTQLEPMYSVVRRN
ncbi:CMRF35-like molecule 8 isoform X2 [Talpa occidentalis]|uniref:CMRF35-like molecule 8 isoform X2 n=1 Tax=Talpa occidentalis TaxID=50954 RepID=UPI0023F87FBF|nr:CMRF35-like molecule 8 isoform X2 [Talpa occidentalis]